MLTFSSPVPQKQPEKTQPVEPVETIPVEAVSEQPQGERPPYKTEIKFNMRQYIVRVTLHKVPPKFVQLEPTESEFILHTTGWSKKLYLRFSSLFNSFLICFNRFPYEDRIRVEPEKCQATFEHNILTCVFPISEIKNKNSGKIVSHLYE